MNEGCDSEFISESIAGNPLQHILFHAKSQRIC